MSDKNALAVTRLTAELDKLRWEKDEQAKFHLQRIHELEGGLRELFEILERKEESDSGHVFHPTTISSCRTMEMMKLDKLMPRLKRLIE